MTSEATSGPPADAAAVSRRARIVVGLLAASIVANVLVVAADANHIGVLGDLEAGKDVSQDRAADSDDFVGITSGLWTLLNIATAIAFIVWFYRVHVTAGRLGAQGMRGKGWTIGAWFVPILNLFRPKQLADDMWRASDPELPPQPGTAWQDNDVPSFMHWWWTLWIVSWFIANVAGRLLFRAEEIETQQTAYTVDLISSVVAIPAAVLAIAFVRRLTARQTERIERVAGAPPAEPAPAPA